MVNTEKQQEEQYLETVYQKLLTTQEELGNLLSQTKEEGIDSLKKMSSDIRLNFDNISDNLDTFSMLEMKNREIDQMNIKMQTAETSLEKVKRLLKAPYFGKIVVDFLDEEDKEQFYIGINNFADSEGDNLIYDWRSPIAELFYNNTIGPSSYVVNRNKIDVEIEKRRQFIIEKDKLLQFFDTSVAIQDDVLLDALEHDSTNEMKDITATIQQEQNSIIRDITSKNILVNGIAGSGKTSTIMQRIAYLLYLYRREITSDNVFILSPNNNFISYISNVLPSLGERNPLNLTILQFVEYYSEVPVEKESIYFRRISGEKVDEQSKILRSKEFSSYIKSSDHLFLSKDSFIKDLTKKDKIIISKEKIAELYHSTPNFPKLIDKIQATKKRLENYWEERIAKQAKSTAIQNQILSLSEDMQKKYFGEIISDDSEKNIYKYGKKLLAKKYRMITKSIKNNEWLDKQLFFNEIYKEYSQKMYDFGKKDFYTLDEAVAFTLIEHMLIEKINVPKISFILVDEVQDYTQAQISLLLELFPKSAFTLVGDENQAIFNSTISFEELEALFTEKQLGIKRYDLLKSYRSSGAITKLFQQLVMNDKKMDIVSVRKDGKEPVFESYDSSANFVEVLTKILSEIQREKMTIITKNEQDAVEVATLLSKASIPEARIEVLSIDFSKGLEFDNVLLYNVSPSNYVSDRDRRILYTAISRAMKFLVVTSNKQLSSMIKPY